MFLDESTKNSSWNIYRCQVCDHVYLGNEKPDVCPHCGSNGSELKDPELWEEITEVAINDDMEDKLKLAIKMELEDMNRYEAMLEECEERKELRNIAIMRRISSHEDEHAELIADLIEMDEEQFEELEEEAEYKGSLELNEFLAHSIKKELEAIELYEYISMNTNDPNVEYIFTNLIDAEQEHRKIIETMK